VATKKILVTGAAGFIGSHVVQILIERGDSVVALDNFDDYYEPMRKRANFSEVLSSEAASNVTLVEGDIRTPALINDLFDAHQFDAVVHLAAMAGVRASIENPLLYYDVNLNGSLMLMRAAIQAARSKPPHFVLASTSSVYGNTQQIPFTESDPCDRPLAPYPASKRAAEMLAYTFHHLYGLDVFVLRFFTVFGPRGRPDMMAFKVADSIYSGREVPLFNAGRMYRDWTFIDDIVSGVVAATDRSSGYEVINLGRGQPILLSDFVALLEKQLGRRARVRTETMPKADIPYTYADTRKAAKLLDYEPRVSIEQGVSRFLEWYEQTIVRLSSQ
jgi:UDP-glucuronate 4-epimerase